MKFKGEDALLLALLEHQSTATREALARFYFYAARALERWTHQPQSQGAYPQSQGAYPTVGFGEQRRCAATGEGC